MCVRISTHTYSYFPPFHIPNNTGHAGPAFSAYHHCLEASPHRHMGASAVCFYGCPGSHCRDGPQSLCHISRGLGTQKSFLSSVAQQATKGSSGGVHGERAAHARVRGGRSLPPCVARREGSRPGITRCSGLWFWFFSNRNQKLRFLKSKASQLFNVGQRALHFCEELNFRVRA